MLNVSMCWVPIDSTGLEVHSAGEWQQEKHGARARCTWRKLHVAVDVTFDGAHDGVPIYDTAVARAGDVPLITQAHVAN